MISPTKAPQMRDAVFLKEVPVLWREEVRARRAENIEFCRRHDLLHGENLRELMSQFVVLPEVLGNSKDCVLRTPTRFTE
jgi:hypothetical protein